MSLLKTIGNRLLRHSGLHPYWCAARSDYIRSCGFLRSNAERRGVDAEGKPIPWLPYPVIDLLKSRLHGDLTVFEYGSGSSTLFFAEHAKMVYSCEHNPVWAEKALGGLNPENVSLALREKPENYISEILRYPKGIDLVLLDGIEREACAQNALTALSPKGVVLLDDTFRPEYDPIRQMFAASGFRNLPISGPTPIFLNSSQATFFYKDGNCLGI